jgi:hypothetical protein
MDPSYETMDEARLFPCLVLLNANLANTVEARW